LLLLFFQMLFELLNMKSLTENVVFEKIDLMINKLIKYFSIEDYSEKSKIRVMEQLNIKLANKKCKKQNPTLFIVKEVNILLLVFTHKSINNH